MNSFNRLTISNDFFHICALHFSFNCEYLASRFPTPAMNIVFNDLKKNNTSEKNNKNFKLSNHRVDNFSLSLKMLILNIEI